MELFGQTVSMKAVDNLNDFVRQRMLEPFDVRAQLDALVTHFDDLTRAHDAVIRAKVQLEMLAPLVLELGTHRGLTDKVAQLSAQRLALPKLPRWRLTSGDSNWRRIVDRSSSRVSTSC
jgi:uncharacterized protein YPO0396